MVIVKLIGGLGNQMFQYAMAKGVAYHHGVPLKLDITGFETEKGVTPRKYELDIFKIDATIASQSEIKSIKKYPIKLYKIAEKILPYYKLSYVKEQHLTFDPNLFLTPKSVYLDGYWQSEKYFKDVQGVIRKDFTFKREPDAVNQKWRERILGKESVAVHFRRGDYISDPRTNEFHGTCSLEYYYEALQLILAKVNNIQVFIFSDDPEWVRSNFFIDLPHFFIVHNFEHGHEDLRLMSLCKHHILANSSFSWWGAWLGRNPNQIVVAPKKWFNNKDMSTKDLTPEHWLRI